MPSSILRRGALAALVVLVACERGSPQAQRPAPAPASARGSVKPTGTSTAFPLPVDTYLRHSVARLQAVFPLDDGGLAIAADVEIVITDPKLEILRRIPLPTGEGTVTAVDRRGRLARLGTSFLDLRTGAIVDDLGEQERLWSPRLDHPVAWPEDGELGLERSSELPGTLRVFERSSGRTILQERMEHPTMAALEGRRFALMSDDEIRWFEGDRLIGRSHFSSRINLDVRGLHLHGTTLILRGALPLDEVLAVARPGGYAITAEPVEESYGPSVDSFHASGDRLVFLACDGRPAIGFGPQGVTLPEFDEALHERFCPDPVDEQELQEALVDDEALPPPPARPAPSPADFVVHCVAQGRLGYRGPGDTSVRTVPAAVCGSGTSSRIGTATFDGRFVAFDGVRAAFVDPRSGTTLEFVVGCEDDAYAALLVDSEQILGLWPDRTAAFLFRDPESGMRLRPEPSADTVDAAVRAFFARR